MKILDTYRPGSKRLRADLSNLSSPETCLIFLVRHGQIQGHETRRFLGKTNVPLDDKGRSQALFWKKALSFIRFNAVYSSSLERCRDTANLITPEQKIIPGPRLNEINMGTWDGKSFEEIKQNMPKEFELRGRQMESFRPPKGESFQDLAHRITPFFNELKKTEQRHTLVVSHAGVIRVLACLIQGMPLKDLFKIKLDYGQLFILSCRNRPWR